MLADIFKVKVPIEPTDESRERDQQLGERRMNVHEKSLLDVLSCKAAEMNFVEADRQGFAE